MDLVDLREACEAGRSYRYLAREMPQVAARYLQWTKLLKSLYRPKDHDEPRSVTLLVGLTGTGKTRNAVRVLREQVADDSEKTWYQMPKGNGGGGVWFDGYDGEDYVLLDEFKGKLSGWPLDLLLAMLHEYPEKTPVKHGFVWWNPRVILVTTNHYPWEWYDYGNRYVETVERRFTKVLLFEKDGDAPLDITATSRWKRPPATASSSNLVSWNQVATPWARARADTGNVRRI